MRGDEESLTSHHLHIHKSMSTSEARRTDTLSKLPGFFIQRCDNILNICCKTLMFEFADHHLHSFFPSRSSNIPTWFPKHSIESKSQWFWWWDSPSLTDTWCSPNTSWSSIEGLWKKLPRTLQVKLSVLRLQRPWHRSRVQSHEYVWRQRYRRISLLRVPKPDLPLEVRC